MRSVHEAYHITEAHMVMHLLEQGGFDSRVDGEHLQGAAGELPVMGLVRVMVSDEDYPKASAFLTEWHAQQSASDENNAEQVKKDSSFNKVYAAFFALGALVAGFAVAFYYSIPVSTDGIDFNGDGLPNQKYTYAGNQIQKTEIDNNSDGKIDEIDFYDSEGRLSHYQVDYDYDGVFETTGKFQNNVIESREKDTDGNGKIDLRYKYKNGNLITIEFLDSDGKSVVKRQNHSAFRLESAEYDSDGDGFLETLYEYDAFEQIKSKSFLDAPTKPK